MADPWNNATSYSPGATVSYNGLIYYRSQYPPTPTSGTPPNVEMGTDDKGDPIRSWTMLVGGYSYYQPKFNTTYFRLVQPPIDPETGLFEFQYSGDQFEATNAYAPIGDPIAFTYGKTVEVDQFKANTAPTPDSPVCPAESCGVGMQQFAETGQILIGADSTPDPDNDRKYYIYVTFNHPLYFRRTITVTTVVQKTVVDTESPTPVVVTYIATQTPYTPTDKNYCSYTFLTGDYFVPANAAFDIIVPEQVITPTGGTTYEFFSRFVSDVTPND